MPSERGADPGGEVGAGGGSPRGERRFFDPREGLSALFYRWVQPPQMAFLVSTLDTHGNPNLTPVTLGTCLAVPSGAEAPGDGYFFGFSVGCDDAAGLPARDAFRNLECRPECVIAYPGAELLERIRIAALPLPRGISEFAIARLTPLPSRRVAAPGVAECGVNLEARVRWSRRLGAHLQFYLVEVVGVSVLARLEALDGAAPLHRGAVLVDPLFEIGIGPVGRARERMFFATLDPHGTRAEPEALGPLNSWIGTFEEWMDDEVARERIDPARRDALIALARDWEADPRPTTNARVRDDLTSALAELVWSALPASSRRP